MVCDTLSRPVVALDLFAGTGWGVACQRLGITEFGVELMPEAAATRAANGMNTIYADVWDGLEGRQDVPLYDLLIASPPCQTFSVAGKGSGRRALDDVIGAINLGLYQDVIDLRIFGDLHDPRTALVLTPLAHVYRDRPSMVVLEQVPSVLPVWEAYAEVMRGWGYSVATGILNAEQYGVPQTRRRAILVARREGLAFLPTPTHSRYYSRDPKRLDPGVLPWVSMAEALGWGALDQPSHTITGGVHGPTDRWASGGNSVRKALDAKIGGPHWVAKPNRGDLDRRTTYSERFDIEDVAALQTYPTSLTSNYGTGGDATKRGVRQLGEPAPTVTSKVNRNKWDGEANVTVEEAAALQSYPTELRPEVEAWKWLHAPATTVAGDPRITAREHHYHGEQSKTSLKLTQDEAHILQTFPAEPPFTWCGNKSKVFLQIGNAVPPLLAQAILSALITPSPVPAEHNAPPLLSLSHV